MLLCWVLWIANLTNTLTEPTKTTQLGVLTIPRCTRVLLPTAIPCGLEKQGETNTNPNECLGLVNPHL